MVVVLIYILTNFEVISGNTLELISIGNDFLNRTQMVEQLRGRIDKWYYMKLKSICATK
jgi:hypothetical protein